MLLKGWGLETLCPGWVKKKLRGRHEIKITKLTENKKRSWRFEKRNWKSQRSKFHKLTQWWDETNFDIVASVKYAGFSKKARPENTPLVQKIGDWVSVLCNNEKHRCYIPHLQSNALSQLVVSATHHHAWFTLYKNGIFMLLNLCRKK